MVHFYKWSYNLNHRLRVIAFCYSLQMRKRWQYFSGHLRAFLRKTRLFRWSSFDCRDLYVRQDQIRLTPIRLGIGSAGCASHSSANLGKSNFPTMFFSHSRHLCLPILSLFCLSFVLIFSECPESFWNTLFENLRTESTSSSR